MGRLSLRALRVAVLVLLTAAFLVSGARAAVLWTLTASPLAVTTGTPTTFTLVAQNTLLGQIRCLWVDVPANFSISAVDVIGSTAGDSWFAVRSGNRVTVAAESGGDELVLLDTVTFTIRATAMSTGQLAWNARSFTSKDCSGTASLLGVPPVVIVTGAAVTPTPVATPVPTPVPTPRPTPLPTPRPSQPPAALPTPNLPLPPFGGSSPEPTTRPAEPGATDRPEPSEEASDEPRPSESGRATPEPAAGSGEPAPSPAAPGTAAGPNAVQLAPADPNRGGSLNLAPVELLSGTAAYAVPAAALAGPGLFILAWVALQTVGVAGWIPAIRRLRGRDHESR